MNYELAKQLKDAGFILNQGIDGAIRDLEKIPHPDPSYVFPTLSELLEACGSNFGVLERRTEDLPDDVSFVWQAHGFKDINKIEVNNYKTAVDLTPEGAVAKLWLEIKSNG